MESNKSENIVLSRKVSKDKWYRLIKNCIPLVNGGYLLTATTTEDEAINYVLDMNKDRRKLPGLLFPEMITLFSVYDNNEDVVFGSRKIRSKDFLISYLIRNNILLNVNSEIDYWDDYNYRNPKKISAQDVVLCKLYIDNECNNTENIHFKAYFIKGIYYWMRAEKIRYDDRFYYILSKEFLNPDPKIPYIKKVENVYDDVGYEVSAERKKLILRKYNLLRQLP